MADRSSQGKDISPGFIARVAAGVRFVATGEIPDGWFGPLNPLQPIAPPNVAGRQFDYPPGYNLVVEPRAYEPVTFRDLRALADGYDLMRLVIETRKDQLSKLKWSISPKDQAKQAEGNSRCAAIADFLAFPDREHGWDEWLRILVEDMLVLDATTIYPRKTKGGQLYALDPVDGATIKRVIDNWGRTPMPPAPAYQQILKGLPAVDYTMNDLFYLPRNPRSDRVYGYSPVEQVVMTVNIGLRRQIHQLQYYTEGSVPEALIGVPETWSPDQISQFQAYWDALMEGNTAQRRHARFVPATISKSFIQTKEQTLKDEYDEWLARIVSYAFNVSNQWAVKQMNRATADTAQEQAQQEGLEPLMKWVKGMMDRIITQAFQAPDLEFQFAEEEEVDPAEQATVAKVYLSAGVRSINEVRDDLGLDPIDGGDVHLIYTASGAVKLEDVLDPPAPTLALTTEEQVEGAGGSEPTAAEAAAAPKGAKEPSGGTPRPASEGKNKQTNKLAKAAATPQPVDRDRHTARLAQAELTRIWIKCLSGEAKSIAAHAKTLMKADDGDGPDILHDGAWAIAQTDTAAVISSLAQDGVSQGYAAIGVSTNLANPRAVSWAEDHAVELVKGLQATTRTALQKLVAQSEAEGWSVAQLAAAIEADTAFSPERAALIAHMETRTADIQGNLIAWRQAKADLGIAVKKRWLPRGANVCPACEDNEADGAIDADDTFSSGADGPPAHVNCECDVEPEIADESQEPQS